MRKFIIIVSVIVVASFAWVLTYYRLGWYIDLNPNQPVTTFMTADEDTIYMDSGNGPEEFTIQGVNMGVGIPGEWSTDYAIDHDTYMRWFGYIQEMGANTIRVYILQADDFYNAFYDYNTQRAEAGEEPLYLLHGVWVNDYVQNSHRDAYDSDFLDTFINDCRTVVDVLHGQLALSLGRGVGGGSYMRDVSQWVIGYIVGVEWEDRTVVYTNQTHEGMEPYVGTYFSASEDASPFESMLARVMDKTCDYESRRYKEQKLMAFSNWPTTDPFAYDTDITLYFVKCAHVDAEHIVPTESFISGYFASYHVYPYYPDYLNYAYLQAEQQGLSDEEVESRKAAADRANEGAVPYENVFDEENYLDPSGDLNTYYAYLTLLSDYHTMPVVISEFGVSTGRGMAQRDHNTNRNQGYMSESEQGQALVECWEDIMDSECAGGCVFSWQDEWFKRTWNTMLYVDMDNTPYWSDAQTNEQYFGLLAFDPGEEESICYVDGNTDEWTADDVILDADGMSLSMKYDEKYLYFYIDGVDAREKAIYLPIDTTPKTGSTYCENFELKFSRACDFLVVIDGEENSRVVVQERYEVLRAMYSHEAYGEDEDAFVDPPDANSARFTSIDLLLQTATVLLSGNIEATSETYETGHLRYGNGNPASTDYDSLADFIFTDEGVEIRLPWQLLNFSNPSEMMIHDDYYEHYGIENLHIDEMYVGLGTAAGTTGSTDEAMTIDATESDENGEGIDERIPMGRLELEGWDRTVTYHERLKQSYYSLQEIWAE